MANGTFYLAGAYGIYWSSRSAAYTSSTISTALYFEFYSKVSPSTGPYARWIAFPLRCLSTVLGHEEIIYSLPTAPTILSALPQSCNTANLLPLQHS